LLLEAATGLSRTDLLLRPQTELSAEVEAIYLHLVTRRAGREPVARILGQREFWGLPFSLSPATLDPRPDSEVLIEAALQYAPQAKRLIDLGTGTGCLLAALLSELPEASGVAVDMNPHALETARQNLTALELETRAEFLLSNWWECVQGQYDLIISNPPYLTSAEVANAQPEVRLHDPALALDGGVDGLAAYRTLLEKADLYMAPGAIFILELGHGQGPAVSALASENGLKVNEIKADYGGVPRALVLSQI
jgi:release factor glutamine methyltransferase